MDFFTEDDLLLLHEYGNRVHTKTRQAEAIADELSTGVWAKTKEWGNRLAGNGFKAECRRSVLKQAGKTVKQADGRQRMRRVFRPYSWAKLYRPDEKDYGIFFTVGVDGKDSALVWKLDCMRDGGKGLDRRLVQRFDEYMERNAPTAGWCTVSSEALKRWDWEKLLKETRAFITDNLRHYEGAIAYTWQGSEPDRDKLARICWNTLDWQRPSGPMGKSASAGSHENSRFAGFGAEEWLFNFERLIDGYHYSFLQPLNSGVDGAAYAGRTFNIRLFTRDEATGEYFLVGRIHQAHVLTEDERRAAEEVYRLRGWHERMQREVLEAGGTGEIDMGEYASGPFNVRFRPTDIERPDTPDGLEPIEDMDEYTKGRRYKLFRDVRIEESNHSALGLKARVRLKDKRKGRNLKRFRQIRAAQVELAGLHGIVQEALVEQLKRSYPGQHVSKEAYIEPYGTHVDVVRAMPDEKLVFYEVKVLPNVKACVREALGQLLEYAHWSANNLSQNWVIVSYHPATPQLLEYLEHIKTIYRLPVSYQQVKLDVSSL